LDAAIPTAWSGWVAAFVQRMGELGWVEGRTVTIEYRWAEGRSERFTEIATEFVRRKVDLIVTGGAAVLAVKEATSIIPIVFTLANDPAGAGLVASLSRPGGNVTGLSVQAPDVAGKRVELLREIVRDLRRLAILANTDNRMNAVEIGEAETAARTFGLEVVTLDVRRAEELIPAFESVKGRADALYVCADALLNALRTRINTLALGARLPTSYNFREPVEVGGFMSYGANVPDLFRRAGDLVDKILRGAKPAELPVEQPTKFDLVINLTAAKALGLTIPEAVLLRADEVIE
jgi:putative ABC transport system substrate-binding protein